MTNDPRLPRLRVSSYLICAHLQGQAYTLLLHGFTGALDKVSARVGVWLESRRGQEVSRDDLPGDHDYQRALESRGYLTTLSEEAERDTLIAAAAAMHDADLSAADAAFVIVPTYTCNLRCAYCFQDHEMHAGRGEFARTLSNEQVDEIFAIIDEFSQPGAIARALGLGSAAPMDSSSPRGKRAVGLFGGEPLSASTREIVERILGMARARGRAVWAITNGLDLAHYADLLGPEKIEDLQITLDGLATTHDTRRVGPGHRKTFDDIVRNIELALSRDVKVSLRMNVDQTNIADVEGLNDFVRERGWDHHPRFSAQAAVVTPEGRHEPLVTQAALVQVTDRLRLAGKGAIGSYDRWARNLLKNCVVGQDYPFKRSAFCSAELGQLIFDPMRRVYSCWDDIGLPRYAVATYGPEGLQFDREAAGRWLARFPGAIDACSRCPYALIHSSGCGKHARDASGTIFANACATFQELFPSTLARAWEEFEAELVGRPVRVPDPIPMPVAEAPPRLYQVIR